MHESVNRDQQRQLALVLKILVESKEAWPTGLLIRFEGPTLQVDDKVLFVRLIERTDDAGVARLVRPLDESVWRGVQRSVQRLTGSSILLRGSSEEMLVCMIESWIVTDEGLEVTFDRHLLAAWRSGEGALDRLVRSAGWGPADDAITGLSQALAGQVVSDEELDRALGARSGQEDQASAARESVESSCDMRAAAIRCRAGVLEAPMGKIKSFGPFGPQYKVGEPVRQLDDGDWLIAVTLVAGGEKEEYRLSKALEDPDAL